MGLFDIFKKKAPAPTETKAPESNEYNYNPLDETQLSSRDKYAIVAFLALSENGAKIKRSSDDYPRYFYDIYKILSPISFHRDVIEAGYLVEAPPIIALKKLKADQLKSILAAAGLSDKGKKDDLAVRIIENINISSLNLETYYIPSEKGIDHLNKYGYVLSLKQYSIKWQEFDEAQKKYSPYLKPNDVIWRILNDKFNEWNTCKCYGLARNELLYMAKLLESENRNVDALLHYVLVLYYDTSGLSNGNYLVDITLAPGIIEKIHKLKDYYDPRIIERCYDRHKLPHHYIKRADFERLVFDIFEDKTIDIKNYIK